MNVKINSKLIFLYVTNQLFYDKLMTIQQKNDWFLMSRLSNFAILTMLSSCIYVTFSVKNDVALLADKVKETRVKIKQAKADIKIFKTELAHLTRTDRILALQQQILPELKVVEVSQMQILPSQSTDIQMAHIGNQDNQSTILDTKEHIVPASYASDYVPTRKFNIIYGSQQ